MTPSTIITESVFAPEEFAASLAANTVETATSGTHDHTYLKIAVAGLILALIAAIVFTHYEYSKNSLLLENQGKA